MPTVLSLEDRAKAGDLSLFQFSFRGGVQSLLHLGRLGAEDWSCGEWSDPGGRGKGTQAKLECGVLFRDV